MVFRLSAFYFAYFLYVGGYVAYFPLYLAGRGLSAVDIAWVLSLPPLARMFAPTFWGWLADRTGAHRAIVAFSCAVTAAAFAALPFVDAIATVIGVMSVLAASAVPLVEAITLGSLGGQHGRYGPIRLWGSVGFILAVLGGGLWLDFGPVGLLPAAIAIVMAGTFGCAVALPRSAPHASSPARLQVTSDLAALLAAGFFMAVAHGALYAFLSVHLEREGYSGTTIGMLWTLGVLAEIGVFVYLPHLFRRYALSTILVASLLCGVARFFALGWAAGTLGIVLLAQVLHAATFGAFHAAGVAAVHRIVPAAAHGRGQTLYSSLTYGAGGAAGTLLAGWAWQAGAAPFAFSLSALAALAGAFFAARLKRAGL
ncbi:MAG: major facilitator superfamily symporter [Burkholderiales bacterium]|jgi:PPP family 3-phenylpropionic acid transporter|nr:major facilitator superfamily symporter [Burkholderiales bacterium]